MSTVSEPVTEIDEGPDEAEKTTVGGIPHNSSTDVLLHKKNEEFSELEEGLRSEAQKHRSPSDPSSRMFASLSFSGGTSAVHTRARSQTYSPWTPDNSPAILTWKNLNVSTKTTPPKTLLHNVSGTITGGFWAIMGASGGGKTSLLLTLSLRLDTSKIDIVGDMRLNGREYQKNALKAMSAYVLQDDLLHAELTVAETLSYAARLRLADVCDNEEQLFRVEEVRPTPTRIYVVTPVV
jgi:ABC-type multidrug transport system fused ATPase/permease subunit